MDAVRKIQGEGSLSLIDKAPRRDQCRFIGDLHPGLGELRKVPVGSVASGGILTLVAQAESIASRQLTRSPRLLRYAPSRMASTAEWPRARALSRLISSSHFRWKAIASESRCGSTWILVIVVVRQELDCLLIFFAAIILVDDPFEH